jgi:hypothetical protein
LVQKCTFGRLGKCALGAAKAVLLDIFICLPCFLAPTAKIYRTMLTPLVSALKLDVTHRIAFAEGEMNMNSSMRRNISPKQNEEDHLLVIFFEVPKTERMDTSTMPISGKKKDGRRLLFYRQKYNPKKPDANIRH